MPVQQRARHTVDAIIQATEELVSARRFDEVNTRTIAERAGVSIGSLYQYFPTYEAILLAWYERVAMEAAQQIRLTTLDVMDHPLPQAIRIACGELLRIYELHWLPLIEMPRQVPQVAQVIRLTSLERLNQGNIKLYLSQHPEFDLTYSDKHTFFIETFINQVIERFVIERPPFLDAGNILDEICFFILSYLERERSKPRRSTPSATLITDIRTS
ncbi:TetR family transcriptional regulator [Novosphingobium sp. GV055]|nr:TetR family transcriptional regulator [Novosphingobium sp. GV055]PUB06371.1 TetR family transcriptional regulator [Novosphingobium sp. GV061]PUB22422.1 TetR family transcriptional regulator [Novosphingobium sp. GV079]PUB44447.1 TetR family transcriptional regulator [Novosphingobium sp. GV027]